MSEHRHEHVCDHSHDQGHHHEMTEGVHTSRASQLGDEPCMVTDTGEMAALRQSNGLEDLIKLSGLLISQYRYKEAAEILKKAEELDPDSAAIQQRLGGIYLTLFRYEDALHHYFKALELGAPAQQVYFACGIASYFQEEYIKAAQLFEEYPGDDIESMISSIYWNTLSACRAGIDQKMLLDFDPDMDAGHHKAYKEAMLVFAGFIDPSDIVYGNNELDDAIIQYGLSVYYDNVGDKVNAEKMMKLAADHGSVWPCISCLAAWNDLKD